MRNPPDALTHKNLTLFVSIAKPNLELIIRRRNYKLIPRVQKTPGRRRIPGEFGERIIF